MHLSSLIDLSLERCWLQANPTATVPSAITRLVMAKSHGTLNVFHKITCMSTLQVLNLRKSVWTDGQVDLASLPLYLPCLQELDLRGNSVNVHTTEFLQYWTVPDLSFMLWQRNEDLVRFLGQDAPQARPPWFSVEMQLRKSLEAVQGVVEADMP